jgi:predicted nucleic acid-binding protein
MGRALLDINVVIALLDQGHVLHRAATLWLERELEHGWATCPITENGVVRIMAQPACPNPQPAAWWPRGRQKPAGIPAMRSGPNRSAFCRRA